MKTDFINDMNHHFLVDCNILQKQRCPSMTFIKESFVQNSCAITLHLIFWKVITAFDNQPVLEL